jgi:hypothetical protein
MLTVKIGVPVKVEIARKGTQKDGTPYALVTIREDQNSESRSKSRIKAWGTDLDEAIVDGCRAVLNAFDEVRIVHEKYGEKYGKPLFHDVLEIRGAVFAPYSGE